MIEKFLNDQQDPKAVEKVYSRLNDLLTTDEQIIYIATQKKPLVNILPDCVALTNKRILFFTPANLGLSIKFIDFVWKDIADVQSKEEIIGAVFSATTVNGSEMGVDYLPKVQARKLYQYSQERKEAEREARRQRELEEKRAASGAYQFEKAGHQEAFSQHQQQVAAAPVQPQQPVYTAPVAAPTPPPPIPQPVAAPEPVKEQKPDELTEKLKKLKMLFDNSLITQEEYNQKKMELLNDL